MSSRPRRFGNLFGRRSARKAARRRVSKRGVSRQSHSHRFSQVESLESRAMLAADLDFDTRDFSFTQVATTVSGVTTTVVTPRFSGGFLGLAVSLDDVGDDVWVHQAFDPHNDSQINTDTGVTIVGNGRNAYSFYTTDTLTVGDRLNAFTSVSSMIDYLRGRDPTLQSVDANGVAIVQGYIVEGINFDASSNGYMTIASDAKIEVVTITGSSSDTGLPTGESTNTYWQFDRIRSFATGAAEDVGFYYQGGGITVDKPTLIDFSAAAGNSRFFVGTPINTAGGLGVNASIQDFDANVTVGGDVVLEATGDGTVDSETGIFVRSRLFAGGGDVSVVATEAADFRMEAGGVIGAAAGVALTTFNLDLTDSSAQIGGTINATTHQYILRATDLGVDATARSITTRDPSTGLQRGVLEGTDLFVTLNNQAFAGEDGSLDIRTDIGTLRVATGLDVALDYAITVSNVGDLLVDSVMASEGDIALESRTGTLDLQAVIDTAGGVALSSFTDLEVDSQLTSGSGGIALSSHGSVLINAAISTSDSTLGTISVVAGADDEQGNPGAGNIEISSLVSAGVTVELEANDAAGGVLGNVITQDPGLGTIGKTSMIEAPSATISASGEINVGMALTSDTESTITAVSGGAMTIRDYSEEWIYDADLDQYDQNSPLELLSLESTDGTITVESVRSILATSIVAGGTGDISLETTKGTIELTDIAAVENRVTLVAEGFEDTDIDPLHIGGAISLSDPLSPVIADAMDFTVYVLDADGSLDVVDEEKFFAEIGTLAATLVGPGDLQLTSDSSLVIERAVTADGGVEIIAQGSVAITSDGISTVGGHDVSIAAVGGGITVGSDIAVDDSLVTVTLAALQSISGNAGLASAGVTAGITAGQISLFAALGGTSSDIGSIVEPIFVRGVTTVDGTVVTVGAADLNPFVDDHFNAVDGYDTATPAELHMVGTTSTQLSADVSQVINAAVTGGNSVLTVTSATVASKDGIVNLSSEYDIVLEDTISVEAGGNTGDSQINLLAGRFINNEIGGDLEAVSVSLEASTFNTDPAGVGYFDGTLLDKAEVISVTATSPTGQIYLEFDREADLELDGISAAGGAVTLSITDVAEFPSFIIGAGDIVASADSTVSLTAAGDIASTSSVGVTAGAITGGFAALDAGGDIDVNTAVGQIGATATGITIAQAGDVRISASNIEADAGAGNVELSVVVGEILSSTGQILAGTAKISADGGMNVLTDVTTLVASATAGDIVITELDAVGDGLTLGEGGVDAGANDVTLVLVNGAIEGAGQVIAGNAVSIELEDLGAIDVATAANRISAVTFDGGITIVNSRGFAIGNDGVFAGDGLGAALGVVSLTAESGNITAGTGTIEAASLVIEAVGSIGVATEVDSVEAANSQGDISIANSNRDLTVTSIQTDDGDVAVSSDDGDVTVTSIVARGDVTITTSGLGVAGAGPDGAGVLIDTSSIAARNAVRIASAGGITGMANLVAGDIAGASVELVGNGGDVVASVETANLTARTFGVSNKLDVTQIGTRPVFIGSGSNPTVLSSTGDLTFTSSRADDADPAANDIIVTELPEFGGVLSFNTEADLIYAVTTSSLTATGSLNDAIDNAGLYGNDGTGDTKVAFSNQIRSSIVLTETIAVAGPMVLDGTLRINLQTGGYTIGRPVDIDGSRMGAGSLFAFDIGAGAHGSSLSGLAFYGFNEDGGAGINIDGADNVVISNNSFGITSTGRALRNANGILIANSTDSVITGNVIVRSSDVGIQVDAGVDGLTISENLIGTNVTRRNYRNGTGILLNGDATAITVDNVDILDNFIAFNSEAGVVVRGGDTVAITGNTVTLNGTGIKIGDADVGATSLSDTVDVLDNEITRNAGNGIVVAAGSTVVTIGSTAEGEANYIGTNARGSRGLGNRANGVLIEGAGAGVTVAGNTILANGTRRSASDQNGVRVVNQAASVAIEDNEIGQNRGDGVRVDGATSVADVVRNSVFANYGSGVRAVSTAFANLVIGSLAGTDGNVISSNRRFGIDLSGGAATVGGNSMLGNRRGGIGSLEAAPTVASATLANGDDLTVTLASALAIGDVVHVYLGTGRSTRSQGLTYLGSFTATLGTETSFTLTGLDPALRVRVGSSITVTLTESDGAGAATASTSEFSRNVSVQRA